ncbi:interleukin-27 subunit alpha-like [Elgaria multicarinata webbii]|uniref:interleukin-27 subunit alpha-like n=1 Tax=Elgaria multicarinata webbii TaxID=159646 RepID=UPI002FCCD050
MVAEPGAVLFLQTLLNVDLLAAVSSGLQEETGSRLESSPQWQVNLQKEFGGSLRLSLQLLRKTKDLTRCYLSIRLPGAQLTLLQHPGVLPAVSLDVYTWLSLPDAKRLSHMAKMLSFYHMITQQLRYHEATKEDSQFLSRFEELSFNLRDLIHHVSYQMSLWGLQPESQPEPTLKPLHILSHHSQWRNRQEVYIILRSLSSFLCRVTRDFVILRKRAVKRTSLSKAPRAHRFPL